MAIHIYYLKSNNASSDSRREFDQKYIERLSLLSSLDFVLTDDINKIIDNNFYLIYVCGGGVERKFLNSFKCFDKPIFLITHGENNSLAASMEINSYIHNNHVISEILHGNEEDIASKLSKIVKVFLAKKKLNGMNLGAIGTPSDWLIASNVNMNAIKEKLGINIINIPMEELFNEINKHSFIENEYTDLVLKKNYDKKELVKALEVYGAIKRICKKYNLSGVTVRCFDLLEPVKTTGCLALAILNAEGIYGGCEGDMPALVSMVILGTLTNKPVFLANPSKIVSDHELILAHCTLPINMPTTFEFLTHYESNIGVAIKGHIKEGECTIFKCNNDASSYFVSSGEILKNLSSPYLCRTQIDIKLEKDTSYFLKNSIGNHHLIVNGDYSSLVDMFFYYL